MEINKLQALIINYLQQRPTQKLTAEELFKGLNLEGASVFNTLVKELALMERSKKVEITEDGKFKIARPKNQLLVHGVFHANDRGFGFVSVEEDEIPDIYISEDHTAYALNMDEVDVKITRPSKKGDDRGSRRNC